MSLNWIRTVIVQLHQFPKLMFDQLLANHASNKFIINMRDILMQRKHIHLQKRFSQDSSAFWSNEENFVLTLHLEWMGTSLPEVKVITCTTTEGLVKKDPTHLRRKCKHKHLPQHACSHILHFWRVELQSESSWIFTHTRIDNECQRGEELL